ncbi:polymorphic toxin type 50 domain-containing protein [Paenibacillus woosongensis]|uniref:Polymorphic toxin type 50 domain-containing protein n=1 Tax=Paenibacillus woosongensis TaxID=307580 RepID=A0AA95KX68_9BACL|nr:phage minor capsid protein [Paenibacillus woosongensis]WHX50545.1 polymorphic toxin type 50 domain-containing protein [Paenibacillus woosongensis]
MARDPYDIRAIFDEMTMNLIASLKRNLSRHEAEEERVGFRFDQWQLAKLRALHRYRQDNKRLIGEAGSEANKLIDDVLQQSFDDGQSRFSRMWDKFTNAILKPFGRKRVPVTGEIEFPQDFKETIEPPKPRQPSRSKPADPSKPIPDMHQPLPVPKPKPHSELPKAPPESDFFGMNDKKLKALQDSVKDDLRKGSEAALRKMDDVYRQVIFKAEAHMAAGAITLDQAIDKATKDFLERGLDVIVFKDGRRVPLPYYAEMALRTASQRATFLGEGKKRDEWGIFTVVMSSHDNCSPWCLPFQGTVLIDDVYTSISKEQAEQLSRDTGYLLLSYAMEQGAFHPACRHTLATYFPGITQLPKPADPEEAVALYEAEQKQRYMENVIRKYKRLELGSIDEANQVKYGNKVIEWQERLKAHLAEYPHLRRDKRREKIDGEVPAAERKELLKNAELNAKIEETRKLIRDQHPKDILRGQQNKHIPGTHEYNQYVDKLKAKGQHGPSRLTITQDEAAELVKQYAGTGKALFGKNGWTNKELIVTNDRVIGVAVDNLTGKEAETTVFKIHYGKKGVHIVPDYPSKKG